MNKKIIHDPYILTAIEAREQGVQLSDTVETSFGTFKNKKGKRVFVMPTSWAIDRDTAVEIDISHNEYKKRLH